jgi:shikimate kinase
VSGKLQNGQRQTPANVILIGFMGTGKSTVARELARLLGFALIDTDAKIVARAGKPISKIFADDGEDVFRGIEAQVLGGLAGCEKSVISTGGGVVTRPENVESLHAAGRVVWLDAGVDVIMDRVSGNTDRPLLQTADPRATVEALLAERRPLYQSAADEWVDTEELSSAEIAYGLAESARVWFGEVC